MYAERVDAKGQKSPCGDTGVESTVSPTAPGSSSTIGRSVPPESKHIVQARTMPTTSSDRQRTPQACDKCRERKTKCSGDHPVCSRCTTRGLICQYSSREPRLRGASKMRLRKASSSVGLRPTQPNNSVPVQQQPQHVQGHSNQPMPELYYFRDFVEDEQSVEHHRSSVAQSNHDFSEFHPNPMTGFSPQEFCEMAVVRYEPSFGGETTARPQRTPRQGFSDHNQHHPQQWWSGVRQVQSHITSEGDASMQFRSHSPTPLLMEGLNSHDSFSIQGSVSPTFQHPLPLSERAAVGQLVHQKALHVDQMYYHSDSDRSSTGESMSYSPISSDDVPEPRPSNHAFGSSGTLSFAQADIPRHQPHFQYSAMGDGSVHPSPALLPRGLFHNVMLDPERELQANIEFIYPSPIAPIVVNNLQGGQSSKQELLDYLGVEFRTPGDG